MGRRPASPFGVRRLVAALVFRQLREVLSRHTRRKPEAAVGRPGYNATAIRHWAYLLSLNHRSAMNHAATSKFSFLELAKTVIQNAGRPMTAGEIWDEAQNSGLAAQLNSVGKTPEASLGARLYTDVQKPGSLFMKLGSRPAKFLLKSLSGSVPNLQQAVASAPAVTATKKVYSERDLHPLLV
jgi:hypothetical protein